MDEKLFEYFCIENNLKISQMSQFIYLNIFFEH